MLFELNICCIDNYFNIDLQKIIRESDLESNLNT